MLFGACLSSVVCVCLLTRVFVVFAGQVRLCGSCVRELVKPARVLEEIKLSHRKYSLRFWTTMLNTLQRPLSAALEEHDDQELNDDLHQMTFTRLAPVRRWMTGTIRRIMGSVDASASKFSS